jgi:hypothetical protein
MKSKEMKAISNGENANTGEIVLYQPEQSVKLEVRIENDTAWLTQAQMVILFDKNKRTISEHINNIFKEGELEKYSVVRNIRTTATDGKLYDTNYYSLDAIISVGYRVKSQRGTQFRIWANKVLKEYILRGYAINQRFERLEYRMSETESKIDFFVQSALPPAEGIFYDGQIFDAYAFVADLVKSAKKSIVLIDNYVDDSVLVLLSKRLSGVEANVYTSQITQQLKLDIQRHNAQYPPIEVREFTKSHDRFLIIDDTVYHIGASLKDLGKKWFAFSKMEMMAEVLLESLCP